MKPTRATIFAYQVGFGDCFLLRFQYPAERRHVLIDFGTVALPESVGSGQMMAIANDIARQCDGKLDAVVATHRHADHISGFATRSDGKGTGDVIRALKPDLVVQPWTEDPNLAVDAIGPKAARTAEHRLAARALAHMQAVSAQIVAASSLHQRAFPAHVVDQLRFIGEDNLSNLSAVKNLMTMGKKRVYTYHEGFSGLATVLPGIKTTVLGPPTLKQSSAIAKQRQRDPDEFWQLRLKSLAEENDRGVESAPLFPGVVAARGGKLPFDVRWLAHRMRAARGDELLQLVRSLDNQMNNTSLILLFQSANTKLLFPGDAQIENWQYALSKPKYVELLKSVDVYKVGHHGSLNATPRSLWNAFDKKGKAGTPGRLKSVMSTKPDKHGHPESGTEVPRETLLTELRNRSDLHSTHLLATSKLCEAIEIAL
jgi:hypothetical protein